MQIGVKIVKNSKNEVFYFLFAAQLQSGPQVQTPVF